MDFSSNSKTALEKAINYKSENNSAQIMPIHFYHVSSGYSKTGMSFGDFSNAKKSNIQKNFKHILPKRWGKNMTLILDKNDNVARKIYDLSLRIGADLILIGSKGRNKMASVLNQSVAAKLLELSFNSAILIDKRKSRKLDAISAMLTA